VVASFCQEECPASERLFDLPRVEGSGQSIGELQRQALMKQVVLRDGPCVMSASNIMITSRIFFSRKQLESHGVLAGNKRLGAISQSLLYRYDDTHPQSRRL